MIPYTAVPEQIELEVYVTVPTGLADGKQSVWGRVNLGDAAPHSFIEGPVLLPDGSLCVVDVAWGRILRVWPDRHVEVVGEYEGEPNGMTQWHGNQLLIADFKHGLMSFDLAGGRDAPFETVLERFGPERFKGVNDLIMTSDGTVYFTDQGATGFQDSSGRLFRLGTDGELRCVLDSIPSPNGLVFDEAAQTLYLAVTRDNSIWRVPLASGSPHKTGRFIQLSGGVGPDGLALGKGGELFVAHLGMGAVWVFDRYGVPLKVLRSPRGRSTSNVTVSDDMVVYVTESQTGTILTANLGGLLAMEDDR